MFMLDTNICIYAIKNKPPQVLQRIRENLNYGLCISTITFAELCHGVEKSSYPKKNYVALSMFLSPLQIVPFSEKASIEYGKICSFLQKQGTPIGTMDMLIAGHARSENLILVTNNVREFKRVPDLKLENWVDSFSF